MPRFLRLIMWRHRGEIAGLNSELACPNCEPWCKGTNYQLATGSDITEASFCSCCTGENNCGPAEQQQQQQQQKESSVRDT